jgi:hypothetical protein
MQAVARQILTIQPELLSLQASSFRTRAALPAEILALPLFKLASISHSRRGCRHADKVFGSHNSAGTACALVQPALRRESDASHVDTTSAVCTSVHKPVHL